MPAFQRLNAGEPISASEFNRAMQKVEQGSSWRVAAPIQLVSDSNGTHFMVREKPFIWVRITGHESSQDVSGAETGDAAKYSGIEQTDDPDDTGVTDLAGGIEFYTDQMYLKEVNGRTDVPDNLLVKAYKSENGTYFTFLFESAQDIQFSIPTGSSCPFWNCGPNGDDICPPSDPFCGDCTNQFWATSIDVPAETDDWCGCYPVGVSNAGCWPYWGDMDLMSSGIALKCLIQNFDGVIALRNACIAVVPGGPFGLRLALISKDTGIEFKRSDSSP